MKVSKVIDKWHDRLGHWMTAMALWHCLLVVIQVVNLAVAPNLLSAKWLLCNIIVVISTGSWAYTSLVESIREVEKEENGKS